MKNNLLKSFFSVLLVVILVSCGSKNDEVLNFTTDTTLALARVNLERISDKIPVDKILKEKKDLKDDEKFLLELVSKPKESGIDVGQPLYVIVDAGKSGLDPDVKAYFHIDDKAKFQTSMSRITKNKVTIDAKDFILVDGKISGSIKGDAAVMSSDIPSMNRTYSYDEEPKRNTKDGKYYTDFWARKGSSSDAIQDQINQSLVKDQDMSGWLNLSAIASYASKGYIETLAVNKLIKDSGIGYNMNFEKGSANINTKSFFNDDMKKIVSKYYDKNKINYDLVKNIELDNANSFSVGYFSLDFMHYLIKEAGFEATINNYLSSTDKSLQDIISTFTGDYAFVDLKKAKDSTDYYYQSNTAFVLGFNPKNKSVLDGLLKNPMLGDEKYLVSDNQIIFSKDNNVLLQYKNKTAAKNKVLDKKSGITAYSWSQGNEYNDQGNTDVKVKSAVNETKEDGGNITSETVLTLDKKDENALYYWIMNA